ncbi:MAG TPA: hypothetical protein VF517_08160 [Thermoleophilaceae bacterium]|jgi:hypothetical protein
MAESKQAIAYEAATRALSDQRASLDNLRSRAASLVAAAAIVTSFLGAAALADTRLTRATGTAQFVPDRSLQPAEAVALGAFLLVLFLCLLILRPRGKWKFVLGAKWILERDEKDEDALMKLLAEWSETYWKRNNKWIKRRMDMFQVGVLLLGVESVAWVVDLA